MLRVDCVLPVKRMRGFGMATPRGLDPRGTHSALLPRGRELLPVVARCSGVGAQWTSVKDELRTDEYHAPLVYPLPKPRSIRGENAICVRTRWNGRML